MEESNMSRRKNHYTIPLEADMPEYISVISYSHCARIKIDDIEVIEQEGRKLHIVTPEREYTFYENISDIVMSLANRAFYRPIKGLVINMDHIKDIQGHHVNFYSGQSVTLGKNSICKVKQAYRRYLLRYPPYSLWEPAQHVAENALAGEMLFDEMENDLVTPRMKDEFSE